LGRGIGRAALCCAITALAATGCGSSKSDNNTNTTSSGGGVVQQPKPKEPISSVIAPFNKAVKDQSCAEFAVIDFSQFRQPGLAPGARPTAQECKVINRNLAKSKQFHLTNSAEYGTAALVEGPAPAAIAKKVPGGKATVQSLWLIDRDGKFRVIGYNIDRPQIGTKPNAGATDNGKNAQAVVDAIKAGDCKKLVPLIHPKGQLVQGFGSQQKACDGLAHGKIFAPALRETASPKAVYMGGTRDWQFYGVATKKTYFTLIMATPPGTSSKPPLLYETAANTDNPNIP
jgi:hypothetical protein